MANHQGIRPSVVPTPFHSLCERIYRNVRAAPHVCRPNALMLRVWGTVRAQQQDFGLDRTQQPALTAAGPFWQGRRAVNPEFRESQLLSVRFFVRATDAFEGQHSKFHSLSGHSETKLPSKTVGGVQAFKIYDADQMILF